MKVAGLKKRFNSLRLVPSGLAQAKSASKAVMSVKISHATISAPSRLRFRSSRCWQPCRAGRNWGPKNGSGKRRNVLRVLTAGHSCTAMQRCATAVESRPILLSKGMTERKLSVVLDAGGGAGGGWKMEAHMLA